MTNAIDQEAKRLYDLCQTPKPTWDQLGETTKSVWRERVVLPPQVAAPKLASPPSGATQHDLFA